MDRYGNIIIIAFHGILCFYASVSGVQPSISPTAYYRVHNPFFVGALVATYIHTAVMYDAP